MASRLFTTEPPGKPNIACTSTYTHRHTFLPLCTHPHTHTDTLASGEAPRASETKGSSDNRPFCGWSQQGPRGWRGGRPQGQDPDPAPPGLRPRDTEVIGVLCSPLPWRTPSSSGRTVGITGEHLTNSHSEYFFHGGLVAQLCPTRVTPWTVAARLLYPWQSPGKNTGVSCHFLLQYFFRDFHNLLIPKFNHLLMARKESFNFFSPQISTNNKNLFPAASAPKTLLFWNSWARQLFCIKSRGFYTTQGAQTTGRPSCIKG